VAKSKKKGNFFYADSDESKEETVDNPKSTGSGELPREEDVNNNEFAGVKSVKQGQSKSDVSGGSFPASSELAR
jgi:hypothetical protein